MCGIALSTSELETHRMLQVLSLRGKDGRRAITYKGLTLGLNRMAIVDTEGFRGLQPVETGYSLTAFNGELYNQPALTKALEGWWSLSKPFYRHPVSEAEIIDAVMQRTQFNFERCLDGYYAIVRIDKGRDHVVISRDWPGVMPLYYQKHPFAVASEKKALAKPREVMPGETLTFSLKGKLLKRRRFDPVSLHMDEINAEHLCSLFLNSVKKRIEHSDVPVTIALSGGLDSSMVLAAACYHSADKDRPKPSAITVALDHNSDELRNAEELCREAGVEHTAAIITPSMIEAHKRNILYHLEDDTPNKIKYAAAIRNYFTAMTAAQIGAKVILCGEGADELGCGYPSHDRKDGIDLEFKSWSTVRSMHAINLDRVNKCGMAWTREFRTPFLDRSLMLYCLSCRKEHNKRHFRQVARMLNVPGYVLDKPKYGSEEDQLWKIVRSWGSPPLCSTKSTFEECCVI